LQLNSTGNIFISPPGPIIEQEKASMALANVEEYLKMLPVVKQTPQGNVWLSYDVEGDVLHVNFQKPSHATDSELTDDDVIIRYEGEAIIGFTILHASQRP
jgi:uncharacterized protein YuzE